MRYTQKKAGAYHWNPPRDVVEAGISRPLVLRGDGRKVRRQIETMLRDVDAFRAGKKAGRSLTENSTFSQAVAYYFDSPQFNRLKSNTQNSYRQVLEKVREEKVPGSSRTLGQYRLKEIKPSLCHVVYNGWAATGKVAMANHKKRVVSVLFNLCVRMEAMPTNPLATVRPLSEDNRHQGVWTKEQVQKFVDTAFEDFDTRSVGLIVLLAYEWAQRPIDICELKWENIDFERGVCTIKQQKRGTQVELPISEGVADILREQHRDFGFQEYVAPRVRPSDGEYRPYTRGGYGTVVKAVCERAGLPNGLRVGDLRRTAIVEMVEAGVDFAQIRSVSGHKNLQSLNPYAKPTLAGAKAALDRRRGL